MRIAIIGCGTAGQAAAIFLARAGHDITILERAPKLGPIGAGLLLQPTGLSILAALGLLPRALEAGTHIRFLKGITSRNRTVLDLAYADLACTDGPRRDTAPFGLGIHRGTLFTILQDAVVASDAKVLCGAEIVSLKSISTATVRERTPERPAAPEPAQRLAIDAAGNTHGPFDLIIVADGAKSTLRNNCRHLRRNRTYPWGALWFVADDPDGHYGDTLFQVYRGTSRMIGFLPSGLSPANAHEPTRTVSMFWSTRCNAPRPVNLDRWKSEVRALTDRADPILDQIHSPNQLIFAAYQDVVMRPWHDGPVVFLGDAAHAMSPQLGQGANLALMDAHALAVSLEFEATIPDALVRYNSLRLRNTRFYQFASRWLTPLFQSGWNWLTPPRDLFMGPMCRVGWFRKQMLLSLAGVKTGILRSDPVPGPILQ